MSHGKDMEFFRENVETLRSAFNEILHHHFLLLSALIPENGGGHSDEAYPKLLLKDLRKGKRYLAGLNSLLDPQIYNAIFPDTTGEGHFLD